MQKIKKYIAFGSRVLMDFCMADVAQSSLGFPIIETNQQERFLSNIHCEEVLNNLRARNDLCDVVLTTDDDRKRIPAHRLILIGASDYFSSLLSGDSQEREVAINDVDGDALKKLVNYCYTGKIEFESNRVEALFYTAKHLRLQRVVDGCCNFIQSNLKISNCLAAAFFAEQQNIKPLFNSTKKFIVENFTKVSNSPDFLLLNTKLLKEFITSDKLNVPSEEFLFEVIMKWIDYEPENRRKHFDELLSLLRLNRMSPTFLSQKVEPLCKTIESHKLIFNALKSYVPVRSDSPLARNNQSEHYLLAISPNYVDVDCFKISAYNLRTCKWTSYYTKIRCRRGFAVTLIDDNLIVVNGHSAEVTSINLRTMDSTELAPLAKRREYLQVAVLNGSIYAIGGFDGGYTLNSVEKWDPATRKWNFVAPMKNARRSFAVAVLKGYLYVCGGCNNEDAGIGKAQVSVECYDPVQNTWTKRAPMKEARWVHCLASYKGYLYAMGGVCNTSAERYDPKTNTWSLISCSPPIEGPILCASLEKDVFIWHNEKAYEITNESCKKLKLKKICDKFFHSIDSILCYVGELGKEARETY